MDASGSKSLNLLLAFSDFGKELREELDLLGAEIEFESDRLFLVRGALKRRPAWAQLIGADAKYHHVDSIGAAAKALKLDGRRWACVSPMLHRRSSLIQEKLGSDEPRPLDFLKAPAGPGWGAWAMLAKDRLVAAPRADSVLPKGEIEFKESKSPPSRAYLKLWETFTLHVPPPGRDAVVADFGSSPGGWTWVLASLAGKVHSIDKAPLAPEVAKLPNVNSIKKDAFRLQPADLGPIDWFFSDIICDPPRLLELVRRWHDAGVRNFVCTIKYKGKTDFATTEKFLEIPGSRLVHLCANKHEVTWICAPQNP